MKYYIVEHDTRGTFIDRELEPGHTIKWKYKFSWSGLRTDEKVYKFMTERKARMIAEEVKGAYVLEIIVSRQPPRLKVRRLP